MAIFILFNFRNFPCKNQVNFVYSIGKLLINTKQNENISHLANLHLILTYSSIGTSFPKTKTFKLQQKKTQTSVLKAFPLLSKTFLHMLAYHRESKQNWFSPLVSNSNQRRYPFSITAGSSREAAMITSAISTARAWLDSMMKIYPFGWRNYNFSYDVGWKQTLYQNSRVQRDLKLYSW